MEGTQEAKKEHNSKKKTDKNTKKYSGMFDPVNTMGIRTRKGQEKRFIDNLERCSTKEISIKSQNTLNIVKLPIVKEEAKAIIVTPLKLLPDPNKKKPEPPKKALKKLNSPLAGILNGTKIYLQIKNPIVASNIANLADSMSAINQSKIESDTQYIIVNKSEADETALKSIKENILTAGSNAKVINIEWLIEIRNELCFRDPNLYIYNNTL